MTKEITVLEALTGVELYFKHLDGRNIRITSEPGMVIGHEKKLTAEGLGMPFYKKNFMNGNLFINFEVVYPKTLTELQVNQLQTTLADPKAKGGKGKSGAAFDDSATLKRIEASHKNTNATGGTGRDSDDEEEEGHGHGGFAQG